MATSQLTASQRADYDANGFVILPAVYDAAECRRIVTHLMDLHSGRTTLAGYAPRQPEEWGRTFNQHLYDPLAMELLLDPRLQGPLEDIAGGAVDGVQTMYFYRGSTQRRHQDQYYLPGCFAAWTAFVDVGPDNGTIWVQPGSHKQRLVTKADFADILAEEDNPTKAGERYNDEVDRVYAANGVPDVPVEAKAGDVVLFSGRLIHRGGPIALTDSFRHVMASHYLPYAFSDWPYADWKRYAFDGSSRCTTPAS